MKEKLKKGILYIIIGFILLFILRLIYGYITTPNGPIGRVQYSNNLIFDNESYFSDQRKNVASYKKFRPIKEKSSDKVFSVDQKYEKIANIGSQSKDFDSDEKKIRDSIKKFKALIQLENRSGLKGKRKLRIGIGVPPEEFDPMIAEIKTIGKLLYLQIDKVDKTNEYKDLNAKRQSLKKTKESLEALRNRAGKIEELIALEKEIRHYEEELQNLGVKLGEFDSENEFVTIKLFLQEEQKSKVKTREISFIKRAFTAFTWTVKYYAVIILMFFFSVLGLFILYKLLETLKWLPSYIDSLDENTDKKS